MCFVKGQKLHLLTDSFWEYKVCRVSFATTLQKHSTSSVISMKHGEVRACQVSTRTVHSEVHARAVT